MCRCENMWNSKFHAQENLADFCIIWIRIVWSMGRWLRCLCERFPPFFLGGMNDLKWQLWKVTQLFFKKSICFCWFIYTIRWCLVISFLTQRSEARCCLVESKSIFGVDFSWHEGMRSKIKACKTVGIHCNKTNMTSWKISIFDRRYIFIRGYFCRQVILVFGCTWNPSIKFVRFSNLQRVFLIRGSEASTVRFSPEWTTHKTFQGHLHPKKRGASGGFYIKINIFQNLLGSSFRAKIQTQACDFPTPQAFLGPVMIFDEKAMELGSIFSVGEPSGRWWIFPEIHGPNPPRSECHTPQARNGDDLEPVYRERNAWVYNPIYPILMCR